MWYRSYHGKKYSSRILLEIIKLALGNDGPVNIFYNVSNLTFKKSLMGLGWDIKFTTPGIKNTNPPPVSFENTAVKLKQILILMYD